MAKMNVSQWVDERLAGLDAGRAWTPDAERGMAQLRERKRLARRRRVEWVLASFTGLAACLALMIFSSPGACARPNGCTGDQPHSAAPPAVVAPAAAPPVAPPPPPAPVPVQAVVPAPKAAAPAKVASYKESGLLTAPVACELYTDYECPSCAVFYKDAIPVILEQYVRTGKVRLIHRDYPLPQHPYARVAARYANAAGAIGQYDVVANHIFRTQDIWSKDGNVDAQVMQVLAPGDMQKVRELVAHDAHLDDTVNADVDLGHADRVDRTPTMVVVVGGKRQSLGGVPQLQFLRTYLDQLLQGH